jgi:ribosomal protein S6
MNIRPGKNINKKTLITVVKQYQGLFILNTAGKVEGADEVLAQVTEAINGAGGKVSGEIEKLENRFFARVTNKKVTSGFYARVPFEIDLAQLDTLKSQLSSRDDVFRLMVTKA